jgi:hypothetical protein
MRRAALLVALALLLIACSDSTRQPHDAPDVSVPATRAALATPEAPLPLPEPPRADPADLARRLRGTAPAPTTQATPSRRTGEQQEFWVLQSDPPRAFQITATLRATSEHAYFYVQDGIAVTDEAMARAAQEFESRVYGPVTALFGEPKPRAIDGDSRVTILHLQLPGVGGYFSATDQQPRAIARISNERQMVYVDVRSGPPGTQAYLGLVAHELQHLVHHARNPYTDAWLTEGLSELANETVSGTGVYLRAFQNAPATQLTDWSAGGNNAPHYGAAHSFLRYLLTHYGGRERAKDLAAQGGLGVNAVQKYLRAGNFGVSFEDVFADWLVAGYLDLPGNGRFSNPGVESKVRQVTRLTEAQAGRGAPGQFGADYYEVDPRGKDAIFRFRGSTTVKQVPHEPASGSGQWWSGRGDAMDATLTREIDLRSVRAATLRFKTWYEIERGYDYAYVTVSTDGGTTWTVLRGRHTTEFNPLGYAYGPGYTGISGNGPAPTWVDEEIDLTPFAGQVALLRFEYVTDETSTAAGFAIDDITVSEVGFADDAEQDSGWQASGFRRVSAPLPQRYLIQLVYEEVNGWKSRRIEVNPDGTAEIRIRGDLTRAGIIIAGATYGTNLPARYEWEFVPAGG